MTGVIYQVDIQTGKRVKQRDRETKKQRDREVERRRNKRQKDSETKEQ